MAQLSIGSLVCGSLRVSGSPGLSGLSHGDVHSGVAIPRPARARVRAIALCARGTPGNLVYDRKGHCRFETARILYRVS